jgi:hypothetical protein
MLSLLMPLGLTIFLQISISLYHKKKISEYDSLKRRKFKEVTQLERILPSGSVQDTFRHYVQQIVIYFYYFILELKGVILDQPSVKFPLGRNAIKLVRGLVQWFCE